MPILLASFERATTQPSLLDSTTTGLPSRSGRKSRLNALRQMKALPRRKFTFYNVDVVHSGNEVLIAKLIKYFQKAKKNALSQQWF